MALFKRSTPSDAPARRSRLSESVSQESPRTSRRQFRRNMTLTGSSSSHIASSGELGGTILSPRAQAHHLHRHRRRLTIRFTVVLVAGLLIYVFIGQLIGDTQISLRDGQLPPRQQAVYEQAVHAYLDRRPSERFYPALNQASMLTVVQQSHPEVKRLAVSLTGIPGEVSTNVELRRPVARWTVGGKEQYVDGEGYVFDVNAFDRPSVEIVDETGIAQEAQRAVTSNRFLSFVGQVVADMDTRGYTVERATMPLLTTRQIDIKLTDVPYRIKMITDRSPSEQVEDAARVVKYLKGQGISPEYVDVRVSSKAFYK